MTPQLASQIGTDLLLTALLLLAPAVVTSLVVGLVVSLLQALTSIQEQTMSFAPRIVAVSLVVIFSLPWMIHVLLNFTERMFWYSTEAGL